MSLLKSENCPICGLKTGALSKSSTTYNGLSVCSECAKKLSKSGVLLFRIKKYQLSELQEIVGASKLSEEERLQEISSFNATKKITPFIFFDDENKKFAIPKVSFTGKVKDLKIHNYSDLLDYELLEDGNSVSKGGVGRAIVGGALFGGVGAIVGGSTGHKQKSTCSKLQIKITMNSIEAPTIYINFIETETKKDGLIYKQFYPQAQEILSILNVICQSIKPELEPIVESSSSISPADEILKFKQLLDSGIITQEEFDVKKQQLLSI